jgi:hypothetical protein
VWCGADGPAGRDCPLILDPFGQWIADDPANPPPETVGNAPALVRTWQMALSTADYLVEVAPGSDFVPWTPSLWAYFDSHYVLVYYEAGAYLYKHVPLPAPDPRAVTRRNPQEASARLLAGYRARRTCLPSRGATCGSLSRQR